MKLVRFFIVLLLITSCKSNKGIIVSSNKKLKKLSARKIIKNHKDNFLNAKTLEARYSVQYSDNRNNGQRKRESFRVRLRVKKDSVIWIKGSKVVNVFRAKITPTEFSFYSPISKEYFTGDYTYLENLLGIKINFNQLQNLFFGHAIEDLKNFKFSTTIDNNSYKLVPKKQNELFDIVYYLLPNNFRVKNVLIEDRNNKRLKITYPSYLKKEKEIFPKKIEINATEGELYTFIALNLRSVEINKTISMPYNIPDNYSKIEFKR